MNDIDFRISLSNLVDHIAKSFKEKPTYEEFKQELQCAIEEWLQELEAEGVYGVVYRPPLGEGELIYVSNAEDFMKHIVEKRFGLKEAYEYYFGRESFPSM